MPAVTAAQHFFSSVPAAQSPTGRRGYQTIACTLTLPAEVVAAIEDRAQYATAAGDPIKRQFHALPGGLVAISQITPLAELDEFGRKGRYLAHTLVFDAATFAALEHCPLDVLAQFPFISTLDAALRQVGPGKGEAQPVAFEVEPKWRQQALAFAARWPAEGLALLGRLAWRASELTTRREPVILAGTDAEQVRMLGLLFLLAAPSQRSLLSFDTRVDGCNFGPAAALWGHGYEVPPQADVKHLLDARSGGRVRSDLPATGDGPYATWMLRDALPSGLAAALPMQPWAAALEGVLTTGAPLAAGPDQGAAIPDAFIERFARLNAPAVAGRWLAALPQGLSPEFSRVLASRLNADSARSLRILADGLHLQDMAEFLFQALLDLARAPSTADRKVLEPWIQASPHAALATLPPFWAGDEKAWAASLAALSQEDYAYVLAELARWPAPPIPLWWALPRPERRKLPFLKAPKERPPVDTERAVAWVCAAGRAVQPEDWSKALDALAETDESALVAVAELLPTLSAPAQRAIAAWAQGYRGEANALRAGLMPQPGQKPFDARDKG
jgi:hypothetical protein